MEPTYGIKETKEVLDFMFAGAGAVKNSLADGKIDLNDLGHLMPVVLAAGPAFTDITKVPKELGDLTIVEAEAVMLHMSKRLNVLIDDAALRVKIDKALGVALSLAEFLAVL